jgi:hypothetical protein
MKPLRAVFETREKAEAAREELLRSGIVNDAIRIATKDDLNDSLAKGGGKRAVPAGLALVIAVPGTLILALFVLIVPGVAYALAAVALLTVFFTPARDSILDHREVLMAGLTLLEVRSRGAGMTRARKILQRYEVLSENGSS